MWHGDTTHFILWGAYHGLGIAALTIYQREKESTLPCPAKVLQDEKEHGHGVSADLQFLRYRLVAFCARFRAVANSRIGRNTKTLMRHISICICTFKRPHSLERLLTSINNLSSDGDFDYSVTVVDNDSLESAKDVVARAKAANRYDIGYFVEPERNISLARNRSVRMSNGELIAFIDDDEYPDRDWLLQHYKTLLSFGPDGVFGPVIPHFRKSPAAVADQERALGQKTIRHEYPDDGIQ